ncbi:MAG: MerR family transcriptional regulator [Candidatus Hydrogenedentota bacterium]
MEQLKNEKLFYSIGEVSNITGIKPYVLRYWETEFQQLRPEKDKGGQRVYRKKDIDLINKIKYLLYEEEFTIQGARKKIKEDKESASKYNKNELIDDLKFILAVVEEQA